MWLANARAAPPFEFGDILMPALLLIGGILVAALVILIVKRWNQQPAAGDTTHHQLALFRDVYQHGEMSPEEYQRVHALLAGKIRQETDVPQPPPAEPPAAESSPNGQPPKAQG